MLSVVTRFYWDSLVNDDKSSAVWSWHQRYLILTFSYLVEVAVGMCLINVFFNKVVVPVVFKDNFSFSAFFETFFVAFGLMMCSVMSLTHL
jgi:hypothetical protein